MTPKQRVIVMEAECRRLREVAMGHEHAIGNLMIERDALREELAATARLHGEALRALEDCLSGRRDKDGYLLLCTVSEDRARRVLAGTSRNFPKGQK